MASRNFSEFSQAALAYRPSREFISTEPTMSRSRLGASAASILVGLIAFYCSLFYLPAYLNQSDTVRISSHNKVNPSLNAQGTPVNWYTPYVDLLRLRRGFFRAGQTIEVEYIMSPTAELSIEIQRCSGPIIYEIFKCSVVDQIHHTESESSKGRLMVKAPTTGFYRMRESVSEKKSVEGEAPNLRLPKGLQYSVVWRRK